MMVLGIFESFRINGIDRQLPAYSSESAASVLYHSGSEENYTHE
jgi:hypothetical protein